MQDAVLLKVADLLIEARGELAEDHPTALRLCIDVAILEVGRHLATLDEGTPDADDIGMAYRTR